MMAISTRVAAAAALSLGLAGSIATPAMADPAGASNWHVGVYAPSGRSLSLAQAASPSDGLAAFQFTTTPDTALLITTQGSQKGSLLGDLTGETVTAKVTITGDGSPFVYYGEPGACGTAPSVRLFFETSTAGGFEPTEYWWSNPVGAAPLADGTFDLTATVSPEQWSDYNGQTGTSVPAGFGAAAANVTGIGLSFGGGCGFENGVGAPDAALTLTSFTAG